MPHQCQRKLRHYAAEAGEINNPPFYKRQWQVLQLYRAMLWMSSNVTLYVHRNNPRNLFIIAQAALEPRWKPVFSRHHHDVRPHDCTVGGDNEPIEKQAEDSEHFLHQHFLAKPQVKVTRSISMIILWRDHKSVLINKMIAADEWMTTLNLISYFSSSYHGELVLQARAQPL